MSIECPKPGIYHGIPAHEYHAWPAISSTFIKGYAALPSTARTPYVPGDDANVGSGIHAFTLQGEKGLQEECVILSPECEGSSKAAKAAREQVAADNPHKALLPHRYGPGAADTKPLIMDVLKGVDESFRNHPKTGPILAAAQTEVSLVWTDDETGLLCKSRMDVWDNGVIWDVKKCRSIEGFKWQLRDLFYELQAGWYFNGAVACGLDPVAFGFLPCEAFAPYRVGCGYLDPEKLTAARYECKRLLGLIKESTLTDNWPNYRIPAHIFHLEDIQPDDLMEVW